MPAHDLPKGEIVESAGLPAYDGSAASTLDVARDVLDRDLLDPLWPGLTESDWATDAKLLGRAYLWAEPERERLADERDRARHLAKHLFQMIDRETWRATGGDDGQGHYEGDYRAAGIEEEIRSWT